MASAYLTPVKDSTISSFDRYIFSLFKKLDNSPTAGPNTVKYQCQHCLKPVKCFKSTNSNLYKHLLRADHKELQLIADSKKEEEKNHRNNKRARVDDSPRTNIKNEMKITAFITPRKKYNINDFRQIEWFVLYYYIIINNNK